MVGAFAEFTAEPERSGFRGTRYDYRKIALVLPPPRRGCCRYAARVRQIRQAGRLGRLLVGKSHGRRVGHGFPPVQGDGRGVSRIEPSRAICNRMSIASPSKNSKPCGNPLRRARRANGIRSERAFQHSRWSYSVRGKRPERLIISRWRLWAPKAAAEKTTRRGKTTW